MVTGAKAELKMNNKVSTSIQGETPNQKCNTVNVSKDESSVPWLLQRSDTSNLVYLNVEEHAALPIKYEYLEHDPNMSLAACYSSLKTGADIRVTAKKISNAASHDKTLRKLQFSKQSLENLSSVTSPNVITPAAYTIVQAEPVLSNEAQVVSTGTEYPFTNIMNHHQGGINYHGQYIDTATGQTLDVMSATSPEQSPITHSQQACAEEVTVQDSQLINSNGQLKIVLGNECYQIQGISNETESTVTYALSQEDGIIIARPTTSIANQDHNIPTVVLESDCIMADTTLLTSLKQCSTARLSRQVEQEDEIEERWAVSEDNSVQDCEDEYTCTEELDVVEYQKVGSSRSGRKIQAPHRDGAFTIIPDVSVLCRARATLPTAHLSVSYVQAGVSVRHGLPSKTRFGPVQGVWKDVEEESLKELIKTFIKDSKPLYLVKTKEGTIHNIDVSDENQANWMCYLRYSSVRPNVWLEQIGEELYVSSQEHIRTKTELRLGYAPSYLHDWPALAEAVTQSVGSHASLEWSCYECPRQFDSSSNLQRHLDSHDKVKKSAICPKLKKRKRNTVYKCNLCSKIFPRSFSLSRHLLTHGKKEEIEIVTEPLQTITETQIDLRDDTKNLEDIPVSKEMPSKTAEPVIQDSADQKTSECSQSVSVSSKCNEILFCDIAVNQTSVEREVLENDRSVLKKSKIDEKISAYHKKNIKSNNNCTKVIGESDCNTMQNNFSIMDNDCNITNKNSFKTGNNSNTLKTRSKMKNRKVKDSQILKVINEISENTEKCREVNKEEESFRVGTVCVICCKWVARTQVRQHAEQHRSASGCFVCTHCAKLFAEYTVLRKHVSSCHAERRFPCPQCGATFHFRNRLMLHMLSHSETRQFLCNDCGKQFKRKDKLKDHIQLQHLGLPKPQVAKTMTAEPSTAPTSKSRPRDCSGFTFVCRQCQVGFKRRGMLVNHMARRHPACSASDVPELGLPILRATSHYYCTYCDKVYRSNAKRKQHILNNHPGEAIPSGSVVGGGGSQVGCVAVWAQHCPVPGCYKQYASKAKLLQHQRRKHPQYKNPILSKNHKAKHSATKPPVVDLSAANFVISRNTEPHVLVTEEQLCHGTQTENSHVNSVVPIRQQELHHNITITDSAPIQNDIQTSTYQIHLTENHSSPNDDLLVKQSYVDEAVRCLNYMKRTSSADFAERQQSWQESPVRESILTQNPKVELSEMTYLKLNADKFDKSDQFQKFPLSGHIRSLDRDKFPSLSGIPEQAANGLANQNTDI